MPVPRPGDPEVDPDQPAGPCRSCGAATSSAQRYCLGCGALVGTRRLDPLELLARREGPTAPPPVPSAAVRAVPVAAAAAAIVVAGLAGSLVSGGGDGARAAVLTRPTLAAAPPAATSTATEPAPAPAPADAGASSSGDDATVDASAAATDDAATADAAPVAADPAPAPADEAPAADDAGSDTTPEDPTIPPHVWLLALEGPRAQEAVDRIADQGVRLTGVRPVAADTVGNATTLLSGALPAAAPVAGAAPPAPTASLPEELTTAKQTWRSYVDAQPGTGEPLPGLCTDPPAGDAAAAILASRSPFGRIAALRTDDACAKGTAGLEALGNDVSSGDSLPSFSYATLGGCAPPERTVVALPDQVADTVTAITESTEFQENGLVIVTTVGATDPCPVPGAPAAPAAPVPAPETTTAPAPAPTAVLRANAKPGSTLDVATDLRALTRLAASTLGVDPPGTSGADDVQALELPAAAKR